MVKHAVIRPANHTYYISIFIYVYRVHYVYIYLYINFERLISRQRALPLELCLDKALDSFPRVLTHKRQRTEISYTSTTHTSTLKDKRFVWCLQDSAKVCSSPIPNTLVGIRVPRGNLLCFTQRHSVAEGLKETTQLCSWLVE